MKPLCFLCSVGVEKLFSSVNEHITQWKATFRLPKHDRMVYSDVNKSDTMKSCVSLLKGKKYILIMIIDNILIQLSLILFYFPFTVLWSLFGRDVVYFKKDFHEFNLWLFFLVFFSWTKFSHLTSSMIHTL